MSRNKTTLTIGKEVKLEEVKELLESTPELVRLDVCECPAVDDEAIAEITPLLNEELECFSAYKASFTDKAIGILVKKCSLLNQLRFTGCQNITKQCMIPIGAHCQSLQIVAFIYDNGIRWPLAEEVDDILSELVRNCVSELTSIAFVGFRSITDIGVNYVSECYFNSLQRVDFSHCSQITDRSLIGLASNCRYLRDVSLNSTAISDAGLLSLAENCTNLYRVDFGNCVELTDKSVKYLAKKSSHLKEAHFEDCSRLGDETLAALLTNCSHLQSINLSGSSIQNIPPLVVICRKLQKFDVSRCKEIIYPPPEVEKGIEGVLDFFKEYNLSYRLKLFVLGDSGSGKSCLVQALLDGKSKLAKKPTEAIENYLWQPLKDDAQILVDRKLRFEEKQLLLDVWDLSGRPDDLKPPELPIHDADSFVLTIAKNIVPAIPQVCQGVHQLLLTPSAVYAVVFKASDQHNCDNILAYINAINAKAPCSVIILIGIYTDQQLYPENYWDRQRQEILKLLKEADTKRVEEIKTEIKKLELLKSSSRVIRQRDYLECLLQLRPRLPNYVHFVDLKSEQSLTELKKHILVKCLDRDQFVNLGKQIKVSTVQLCDELFKRRQKGTVIITWDDVVDIGVKCGIRTRDSDILKTELAFLQLLGLVIIFQFRDDTVERDYIKLVCINPSVLARTMCLLHVDDNKKSFRIEAKRFWPSHTGCRKPDPSLLVRALEEIPNQGLIRECLFPLLWQEIELSESQVKMILTVMEKGGIIVAHTPAKNNSDGLSLPHFTNLSSDTRFYAPLLNQLPDNRPQLNWTPKPFKGDIQLNWRYDFYNKPPPGLIHRLEAVCRQAASSATYQHAWKHGVLFRIGEALVCVCHGNKYLDLCCRVNADEEGHERSSVEYLWAQLISFIEVAHTFLQQWPGLFYKISLVPMGMPLYNGDVIGSERSFELLMCLDHLQSGTNIVFTEDQKERQLDIPLLIPFPPNTEDDIESWIQLIVSKQETVLSLMDSDNHNYAPQILEDNQTIDIAAKLRECKLKKEDSRKSLKKNLEVRWNLGKPPPTDETSTQTKRQDTSNATKKPVGIPNGNVATKVRSPDLASGRSHDKKQQLDQNKNLTATKENASKTSRKESSDFFYEAHRLASGFVAAVLASAVAEYIKLQHEENHRSKRKFTSAQVGIAKVTAQAAMATQAGHVEDAAQAVMSAAREMQAALDKQEHMYRSVKSRMCTLL